MTETELQEKIRLLQQCQKVLYELHEELGTRFAKPCADYLNYTLDSLNGSANQDARKEFAVGQKVTLVDKVQQRSFLNEWSHRTYEKGAIGWIVYGEHMLCGGDILRLDSEKVKSSGFDAEGVTEYLWNRLTRGRPDTTLVQIDQDYFSDRVEEALLHLNFPAPRPNRPQLGEVSFDDLSKHQFWQHRQDLFKLEKSSTEADEEVNQE